MTFLMRAGLCVLALATLSGCAHLVAPLSERQIDRFHGHRTLGARIEDQVIEYKSYVNIRRQLATPRESRIVSTSWNGQLLLAGQVPTDTARAEAGKTAAAIRHVEHVHNELETGKKISRLARLNDGWITTRIKLRLLFGPDVPARRIKVVTENGVVYLMGLLNQAEAEQAVQSARKTRGVQKIVKIFEYIEQTDS